MTVTNNQPTCSNLNKTLFNPQPNPIHLRNELCQDGWLARPYASDVKPNDLVDMKVELEKRGVDYFGDDVNRTVGVDLVDGLSKVVGAVETAYQQGKTKCIPYITAGYRSYEYQAGAFAYDGCVAGVNDDPAKANWCGTAPPGFSTHQTVAVDIWCYYLVGNSLQRTWAETIDGVLGKQKLLEYGFIKPLPNDPPHYNYVL